jgi:hypothetical protein
MDFGALCPKCFMMNVVGGTPRENTNRSALSFLFIRAAPRPFILMMKQLLGLGSGTGSTSMAIFGVMRAVGADGDVAPRARYKRTCAHCNVVAAPATQVSGAEPRAHYIRCPST